MSFLPGLGLDEPENENVVPGVGSGGTGEQVKTTTYELTKETEWRFELGVGRTIEVKITQGSAELFGTELVLNRPYTFISRKAAIFTWTGCTIEATGETGALVSEYVAEETGMNECINTHFALETLRDRVAQQHGENGITAGQSGGKMGPRVLILGPDNAGKSTLAKELVGYAIRSARSPVVVNLDPNEGVMSLPGTVSATVFQTLIEVEGDAGAGWGTSPMSGPNGEIPVKLPLAYYFGGMDPSEKNGSLYKALIARLALAVQGRMAMPGQEEIRMSGLIVDTPGSIVTGKNAAGGYDIVAHIVSEFTINAIICVGSERLYSDIVKKFDGQPTSGAARAGITEKETISVIKLPKSGGVADRDASYMRALREAQTKAYFYGDSRVGPGISLQPRQQQVEFDSLPTVWRRISSNNPTSMSGASGVGATGYHDEEDTFLPGGADDSEYVPPATIGSSVPLPANQIFERLSSLVPALRNCALAVMNCPPDPDAGTEQEVLRDSSVMGFLYVTDVDEARGRISLLSPVAGRVPNRALVWGEGIDGVFGVVG